MSTFPRPSFSLRALFVFVTVLAVYLGWATNWIQQRRKFQQSANLLPTAGVAFQAPGGLWLLGEKGFEHLYLASPDEQQMEAARRLFPEAEVIGFDCILVE